MTLSRHDLKKEKENEESTDTIYKLWGHEKIRDSYKGG